MTHVDILLPLVLSLIYSSVLLTFGLQDIDLDHYDMKEEEPVSGKKSEDDDIERENLIILEKIRRNQRQDHLNVSGHCLVLYRVIPKKASLGTR